MPSKPKIVLGIESSCDETAAAVAIDGRTIASSVVFSQVPLHQPYGGVVPEIASRSHVEKIPEVLRQAIDQSGLGWERIEAVAATYGPGLASSLLVGLSAGKGLALSLGVPFIGVNHLAAHIHSVFLAKDAPSPEESVPLLALVCSGGHTCLVDIPEYGRNRIIGQTLDDAAGEAFDKAAKLLGLGYPGGPVIDKAARRAGNRATTRAPTGRIAPGNPCLGGLRAELCLSFSGLKTSLMRYVEEHPVTCDAELCEIASSYQEAIVGVLADRCARALRLRRYKALAVGGGVSLNARLRDRLSDVARAARVRLLLAEPRHCGDNAAMVAAYAAHGGGVTGPSAFDLDATPDLPL